MWPDALKYRTKKKVNLSLFKWAWKELSKKNVALLEVGHFGRSMEVFRWLLLNVCWMRRQNSEWNPVAMLISKMRSEGWLL